MTYRERRATRAERLRGWAEKRASTARATLAADDAQPYAHDIAFLTQPGHIPERARMIARDDRAHESLAKAASMSARADSIERAADRAIYDDDPDAIERLRDRIAGLEAQRANYAQANADYRKAHRAELAAMSAYERSQAVPRASWELSNLGGQISKARDRLRRLEHPQPTWFHASRREPETCYKCDRQKVEHTPHDRAPSILMCPTETVA